MCSAAPVGGSTASFRSRYDAQLFAIEEFKKKSKEADGDSIAKLKELLSPAPATPAIPTLAIEPAPVLPPIRGPKATITENGVTREVPTF